MPAISLLKILIYPIQHPRVNLGCARETHAERKVVQAGDADGLAVDVLVYGRDGGEDEVDEAVDEGHVDPEELDDGFAHEEREGPDHAFSEDAFPAIIVVLDVYVFEWGGGEGIRTAGLPSGKACARGGSRPAGCPCSS